MHSYNIEQHYAQYHLQLLKAFIEQISQQQPFVLENCSEEDQTFLQLIKSLSQSTQQDSEFLFEGQQILCRIVTTYPHLMPLLYRDLLWFFGGDCLHFMPDDEIARYQHLDELRHEAINAGKDFSYADERAKLFGLH